MINCRHTVENAQISQAVTISPCLKGIYLRRTYQRVRIEALYRLALETAIAKTYGSRLQWPLHTTKQSKIKWTINWSKQELLDLYAEHSHDIHRYPRKRRFSGKCRGIATKSHLQSHSYQNQTEGPELFSGRHRTTRVFSVLCKDIWYMIRKYPCCSSNRNEIKRIWGSRYNYYGKRSMQWVMNITHYKTKCDKET